ncbi:MAG: shikimate dehydrogenase [Firmicutes bacterium]|nr:shikimate dehydrogenase [Bacillota bacterium]
MLMGVMGWPVHHSASPAMMNAAFREMGLEAVYVPFAVPPSRLAEAIRGLAALGVRGVNVTIPHKETVCEWVDHLSEDATRAGAVNLVRIDAKTGSLEGHNSDIIGWYLSVSEHLAANPNAEVLILGAGGATRGIVTALSLYSPRTRVQVTARRPQQSQALVHAFQHHLAIEAVLWEKRGEAVAAADMVINATPIGMWPQVSESPIADSSCFRRGQVVQDIIYRPLQTRFLEQAEAQGATVLDGLWMLVHQGAVSVDFWVGQKPPLAIMREAALRHVQSTSNAKGIDG